MSWRSFLFGDINKTDAWELPTEEEEPNEGSLLQDLSNAVEGRTGISLHQCSHTRQHGILGLFGHVDESYQNWEAAYEEWQEGNLTDSELGYACGTWHDAENHKPGWKYFLGL